MTRITKKAAASEATTRWGFIGAGRMATALIEGMLRAGLAEVGGITASDPSLGARSALAAASGIEVVESNAAVARQCDVIVLAVKPQTMAEALEGLRPHVSSGHLVVSVAAGTTIATISRALGADRRVVRVMSNTPALVGQGASAYALGPGATAGDEALVRSLLEGVGVAVAVPESQLDAVTGLSGSGPAFVYLMIEALADGGVRAGLPRDAAALLAAQTVLGAARMVCETGLHPGVLKDQVASPGGTTIAGLHALENAGARGAFMDAVLAASRRAGELAQGETPR